MPAAPDDRTIRQQTYDVTALYAYLSAIASAQDEHRDQLDELADALAQHTATLAGLAGMQAHHSALLADQGARLDRILEILERL
jgi:uncharacterized membrane protein